MIFLIDDTNLESTNATFLLGMEYQKALCLIQTVDELEKKRDDLSSADCIMIHRSFASSSVYKEQMAELTNDGELIPFVVFSAGDPEYAIFDEKMPRVIMGLKKSLFYSRLFFFLDSYITKQTVNLRILAYGNDYMKIRVRSLALSIMRFVEGKEGLITIQELAAIASCPEFKEIVSISNPELGISYDELLENLEDYPISFSAFKNNINQIVNSFCQHGKNIYTWK